MYILCLDTAPILMVVGGSNENGLLNDVELISETNTEECSKSVSPMRGNISFLNNFSKYSNKLTGLNG